MLKTPATIKDLSTSAAFLIIGLVRLLSDEGNLNDAYNFLLELRQDIRRELFEHLRNFLVSPWWQRIWVVQEVTVSSTAVVQYGTTAASWELFRRVAQVLSEADNENLDLGRQSALEPENLKVLTLLKLQLLSLERTRRRWNEEEGIELIRLLQEFSVRKASDDRDKVYALLSLAKPGHGIRPYYGDDVFQAYRRVALSLIRTDTSLSCWSGDQRRKDHKDLPSWVPDWSTAYHAADSRRMDLRKAYDVSCGWDLRFIDDENEYWISVEEQMRRLGDSLERRPLGKGHLPASLRPEIIRYTQYVSWRFNELHLRNSDSLRKKTLDILPRCQEADIIPRSSRREFPGLHEWIKEVNISHSTSHLEAWRWDGPIDEAYWHVLEYLDRISHDLDDKREEAQYLVEYLESLRRRGQHGASHRYDPSALPR